MSFFRKFHCGENKDTKEKTTLLLSCDRTLYNEVFEFDEAIIQRIKTPKRRIPGRRYWVLFDKGGKTCPGLVGNGLPRFPTCGTRRKKLAMPDDWRPGGAVRDPSPAGRGRRDGPRARTSAAVVHLGRCDPAHLSGERNAAGTWGGAAATAERSMAPTGGLGDCRPKLWGARSMAGGLATPLEMEWF